MNRKKHKNLKFLHSNNSFFIRVCSTDAFISWTNTNVFFSIWQKSFSDFN